MTESPKVPGRLESIQGAINAARDGLILIVLLLLLILPGTVNRILIEAGFTRASILGFDWEKRMELAAQQTEAAMQEVERLKVQLGAYATRIDRVAQPGSQPLTRPEAQELASDIRASQLIAAGLGRELGSNLASQRELQSELKRKIQYRVP